MKYYTIGASDDLNQIGAYPQVQRSKGYKAMADNSYHNVSWDKLPDFTPNYEVDIVDKGHPTNYLHNLSGFYGFTVDSNFKNILEQHHLPTHNFYPVNVQHNTKVLDYYWFHFINSLLDYVDFNQSTVEIFTKTPFQIVEEKTIASVSAFHQLQDSLNFEMGARVKKIVVKDNFPGYDVISLWNLTPLILISEKLAISLKEEEMTGYELREYPGITFKDKPNV